MAEMAYPDKVAVMRMKDDTSPKRNGNWQCRAQHTTK